MKAQLFEITHTTLYRYFSPVLSSYNLMRLTPRRDERQKCLAHTIEITPTPGAQSVHTDYFGNEVTFASLALPHQELCITSRSKVTVTPPYMPDSSETSAWETVGAYCISDRSRPALEAAEFLYASPQVPIGPGFASYATPSFTPRRPILEAVLDLTERIFHDFTFDPTATTVATPLEEVLANRRGVCQDFAHFQIACLRSLGLPARYVSGYLETVPPPGCPKLTGADASHAWLSFYCPGIGWIDMDPTNNLVPSMSHVTLAWGRDYGDVCPVRGVVSGGECPTLSVAVDVVALEEPGA
ncbi:MAG: transglutaminase N-terminal domain-containing protein [Chthoniobacteraceae bacterium]